MNKETCALSPGLSRESRASPVVEDHFRRLDAAIYGLCPIQETARAILGIEEIRDNFEHHGVGQTGSHRIELV